MAFKYLLYRIIRCFPTTAMPYPSLNQPRLTRFSQMSFTKSIDPLISVWSQDLIVTRWFSWWFLPLPKWKGIILSCFFFCFWNTKYHIYTSYLYSRCQSNNFDFHCFLVSTFYIYILHLFIYEISFDLPSECHSADILTYIDSFLPSVRSVLRGDVSIPELLLSWAFFQYYSLLSLPCIIGRI